MLISFVSNNYMLHMEIDVTLVLNWYYLKYQLRKY